MADNENRAVDFISGLKDYLLMFYKLKGIFHAKLHYFIRCSSKNHKFGKLTLIILMKLYFTAHSIPDRNWGKI